VGALLGGPREGGSFAGDLVGYERKALETGISLNGAKLGNLECAHLPETFRGG